ncbi:hypothetical protein ACHAWC_004247 [Mediolabrus comicus]
MSASLRQEFVSEFKAFYKLDKKKSSSLKQPDDASIDSNSIIKGGGGGGGDEKENNSSNTTNKIKIESSSSPTKSIEYFNNPPGRQKLTMETGGKWTMASNRGPNAILSPAAATATSSDDNSSSTRNNDNVSISRSIRSNGNRSSKSSQDETLWKEFKHEFVAYYMKKPAIVLSLDDSYEIEQQEQEEEKEKDRRSESIPRELSFEERYSKMYKLHTQNTGVDVAEQEVAGVGNVQEEEEEVEGDDPALLLQ